MLPLRFNLFAVRYTQTWAIITCPNKADNRSVYTAYLPKRNTPTGQEGLVDIDSIFPYVKKSKPSSINIMIEELTAEYTQH